MIGQLLNIAAIPRLARIASAGAGAANGLKTEAAIGRAMQTNRAVERALMGRNANLTPLAGLDSAQKTAAMAGAQQVVNQINQQLPRYKTWQQGYDDAAFLDKAAFHTGRLAGGAGSISGAVLNNPAGAIAASTVPFMMFSGGGDSVPVEQAYQPMTGYVPPDAPPMPPEMMLPSPLDAEQAAKAQKRAQEQAALNQFYAQALQQYGGN